MSVTPEIPWSVIKEVPCPFKSCNEKLELQVQWFSYDKKILGIPLSDFTMESQKHFLSHQGWINGLKDGSDED